MKKIIISLISIILMIFNFWIFIPNRAYGICNTFNFKKKLSAVQLTLANGQIIHDIRVDKNLTNQTALTAENYKDLKLVFILEDEDSIYYNRDKIKGFINKIYDYYGVYGEQKIKIGITTFSEQAIDDQDDSENNIYNSNKDEILNKIDNLSRDKKASLTKTLERIVENGGIEENDGGKNSQLLQQIVLITDGINEEESKRANSTLSILSNNMVAMYLIKTSDWDESELVKKIYEMKVPANNDVENIGYQLENDLYEYISEYVINDYTFMPEAGGQNAMMMSDKVALIADTEIVQGAVLKIEYNMPIRTRAYYGSGEIFSLKIEDEKDPKLAFSKDERLITDPSKTNEDYDWRLEGEKLITEKTDMAEAKLILTVILSPNQLEEAIYSNTATCNVSFDVGDASTADYTMTQKAMDVQVIPPFSGEEEKNYNFILCGIIGIVIIGITGTIIKRKKSKVK